MEGYCSTGQSPQWAVVPMEEDEEEVRGKQVLSHSMTLHTTYRSSAGDSLSAGKEILCILSNLTYKLDHPSPHRACLRYHRPLLHLCSPL